MLLLVCAVILGVLIGYASPIIVRRVRLRRTGVHRELEVVAPDYDTRIDAITESGLERFKLNKALTNVDTRRQMVGTALYARAAPVLGWEE